MHMECGQSLAADGHLFPADPHRQPALPLRLRRNGHVGSPRECEFSYTENFDMLFQIAARPRDPTLFPPMTEEEVNRIMATPRKQAKKYVPPNMRGQGSIPGLGKPKWG